MCVPTSRAAEISRRSCLSDCDEFGHLLAYSAETSGRAARCNPMDCELAVRALDISGVLYRGLEEHDPELPFLLMHTFWVPLTC